MRISVEFNLIDDTLVVHWPWGRGKFTEAQLGNFFQAMKNGAINFSDQRHRVEKGTATAVNMAELREAIAKAPVTKVDERGKKQLPSLEELFDED